MLNKTHTLLKHVTQCGGEFTDVFLILTEQQCSSVAQRSKLKPGPGLYSELCYF